VRNRMTLILLVVAVALAGIAWFQGGPALAWSGLVQGARTLLGVLPMLLAAFVIAGLIQTMISRERVARWMGEASGWRGIGLAFLAGAVTPGGPYVYYPIVGALMQAGASLGVLVTFVTAKNLWSLTRLPLEFALLGPHLAVIRLGITLVLPPLLGALAQMLFGSYLEKIRQAASL
jgi:uncharacterized membrane protein YraQ (UPF0718 family)